ncbi:MAG TPA: ABC transporter ATP-binding protein [Thermodesulfobacteriota bacterium]|nr:ABC transporter ATP-binding protein [Thermodesulfobacteriota bacterium]
MASMLEVKNVSKLFGGLAAVKEVSLSVQKDELLSIIGPNGSGKTTFFNLITGVYEVSQGSILFEGEAIHNQIPNRIAEKGIARTFQNIKLFHTLSVLENVLIASYCHGHPKPWPHIFGIRAGVEREKQLREVSHKLLEFVGLARREDEVAKNLAYGDQKKLEIARALAVRPKLLLLDEPVGGLNPAEKKEIISLIGKIQAEGITVLLIEHDMRMVMNISKRIIVLNFGQMIAQGTPEEIKRNPAVIEAYLGPELA